MVIWKATLGFGKTTVMMPEGATVLHVHDQFDAICIWYLCSPKAPVTQRNFLVLGTGDTFFNYASYLGSVHQGLEVWHVLEIT